MSFQRIYAIFLRQFFLLRRSPNRILQIFYWSLLELTLWGIITKYLYAIGGEKFGFITVILGTVIFWNFFTRVMNGITISFLEDVWSRNLINLFASPLKVGEYIAGLLAVSIIQTLLAIGVMVLAAWFFFSYSIFQFGFFLIPFILILFISGWALGIFTTAVVLRFGPSVEILVWSIPTLIMPFSAIFYPLEALPPFLRPISYMIPISYVFEGMREIVHKGTFNALNLAIGFALSLLFFFVAIAVLFVMYRMALRKGLFTRFMTD